MDNQLSTLQNQLLEKSQLLSSKTVTAGFDGFVDSIIKVVKAKPEHEEPIYFKDIKEFGIYITDKAGTSFSLETVELFQKLGGNMPILSNALAQFGVKINCLGAFGEPTIHPAFGGMHSNCQLHSFASPGITSALEFGDGKMLLGQMQELNSADWSCIKDKLGLENIIEFYRSSDLFCFVNWGELDHSSNIWQGVLSEVLPAISLPGSHKKAFFDLSDCSNRSTTELKKCLSLIEAFSHFCQVTLSLNRNEAQQIYKVLFDFYPYENPALLGKEMSGRLKIENLLIHTSNKSFAWNKGTEYTSESLYIENPKILTGAGDHFNAGFCLGLLVELDIQNSLYLANTLAAHYIKSGRSPKADDLYSI